MEYQPKIDPAEVYPDGTVLHRVFSDELLATVARWKGINSTPDSLNRQRRDGIRIFRNSLVEQVFSKAHPVMPIIYTAPFIAFGWIRGIKVTTVQGTLGLFLVGILLWTLLEYVLHRYAFHWEGKGPGGKMFSFMMHGYHHEFPDDKMRLVAPPLMLFSIAAVTALLYRLVLGPDLWAQIFAGTVAGYVLYDWTHYYTHHFHPKRGLGAWIRRYHLKHHFQEGGGRFGISSPLWDLMFGTYRSPNR